MNYQRRTFRLPAEREDELVATLWSQGALGCEVLDDQAPGKIRVVVYFAADASTTFHADRWRLLDVTEIGAEAFAERDWLAEYRAHSQPIPVGRRFVIDPRDLDDAQTAPPEVEANQTVLQIPAQNAFGTGSHGSTRLTIELMEAHAQLITGAAVLDVGTGSGILALVALHLGAARLVGFDLDSPSVITAQLNARRETNAPPNANLHLFAGTARALAPTARFDVALVNVLPERVVDDYPSLIARLQPGAHLISSGNLVEHAGDWKHRLAPLGLVAEDQLDDGEWIAFLFRKA